MNVGVSVRIHNMKVIGRSCILRLSFSVLSLSLLIFEYSINIYWL